MHYYQFNIGDYAAATRHLSPIEDIAYRRLLDLAYTTEAPIIHDIRQVSRQINLREHQQEVEDVLMEFFESVEEGWIHNRVLKEIEATGGRSEKAKQSAKVRWDKVRNANAMREECECNANASKNHANASLSDATQDPRPITQDQLPTNSKPLVASDAGRPDCPHEKIIELYHEVLPELKAVKLWTPKRKALLQARWREDEKRQNLDYWRRLFGYVRKSEFLMGADGSWKASLEFIVTSSKFVKLIEGDYHVKFKGNNNAKRD